MTSTIKLKKSSVAAKVPQVADLAYGELALNYADGKLYFKNSSNEIVNFNDSAQTVDIVLNTINKGLDYVDLNADSAPPAYAEGRLYYSDEYKAITYRNDIPDVSLQVGLEEWVRVYNNSGSTITNGTPVYSTGANGKTPTVAPADATTEMKARVLGIATHDIANASEGVVTVRGLVSGIDTSHLTAGQPIHVAADGSIQTLAPTYPYFPTDLGGCVVSDSSDGYIYIDIESHTYEQFRVTGNQHIGGNLTIEGDLTVTGTQSVVSQANLAVDNSFIYTNSGNTIGVDNTNFTGSGLDDAIFTGHYSGTTSNKIYYVRIDGTGTPDTFEWSLDNFSTTEATDIAITGDDQELEDGVNINFNATTGHTLNDTWDGEASPVNVDAGFSSNRNTGGTGVGYTHMGLFFDVSDEKWKLFKSYDPEPEGTIDTGDASYEKATLDANVTGNVTGDVSGNTTTATALETSRNFSVSGDVTASAVSFNGTGDVTLNAAITAGSIVNSDINASAAIADTKLATISTSGKVSNSATTATDANTNSAIVARDASGNFSAGTITADLIGNATTATTLETARTIGGVSFNGSTNINLPGVNTAGNQNTSGNAATATALATGRNFSVSGDATTSAPVSFDGTGNVDLGITLSNSGVSSGSYGSSSLVPVITVDAKGRITSLTTTTVDASGVTGITYDSATGQFILQTDVGDLATTITLDPFTTADLTENTNLYYTTSRANSAIDARVTKSFVDALNVDADTLDGQQGSYYLDGNNFINLPAGYTGWTVSDGSNSETIADGNSLVFSGAGATDVSYNTASNTLTLTTSASDILTQIKTVDGSASGLDADLLDGQQGSYYTTYADNAIANLVASAPGTLDTLNELAAALGDDPNFATTVTNSIATKLSLTGGTLSGDLNLDGNDIDGVGTITGSLSGNATTATTLQTARTIGGVSFNGSSNINLPGVNTVGNQNTTGSAATLTTARTIGGVSFNGSSNINLPGVNTTGNQDTTGSAARIPARTIALGGDLSGSTSFDGSSNVTITATVANNSHTHTIANVTGLQTALDAKADDTTTVTAGSGLTGGGSIGSNLTISHADTSTQSSVNNSAGTVIQDITLDTYGHLTGITSANLDDRYYTETEADSRFLNASGDTLTGTLNYRLLQNQSTSNYDTVGDNSGFSVFYGSSSATNKPSGTDHAVATFSYSDAWQSQLAMDWRTNAAYLRTQENGTWKGWNQLFTDGYHPNADKWTTARTLSLTGDASGSVSWDGSGNASLSVTVADDSHTHDGRYYTETEADSRFVNVTGDTMTGDLYFNATTYWAVSASDAARQRADARDDATNFSRLHWYGNSDTGGTSNFRHAWYDGNGYVNVTVTSGSINFDGTATSMYIGNDRVFDDGYHPNADKWTTARTLSLSGDASGSVSWDGSANASLSVTVNDNSHNHTIANVSGLQTALDGKLSTSGTPFLTGNLIVDQASSGNIVYKEGNGVYIPRPLGGSFVTTASTYTGACTIKLPVESSGQSDMLSFWVDIYDYQGVNEGESVSLYIYGYQYSSNLWTNTGAVVLSDRTDRDYTVRFGHDGTRPVVHIGETNTSWSYPQVTVRDFQAGYAANYTNYASAWDVAFETSYAATISQTSTANYPVSKEAASLTTARTISLGGDLSGQAEFDGSSNITINSNISSGVVGATELNVSGNGTNTQFLRSDGDGSFTWADVSGGISFVRKTTTYTATANQGIIADTSAGPWTLTLPSSPAAGTQVIVGDGGSWAANNLTINRNGSTIESVADNYLLDVSGAQVQFIYDGTTWQVYSNPGVVNSTDSISIINSSGTILKTIYSA